MAIKSPLRIDYVLNPSPPEDASRVREGGDGPEFGIEEVSFGIIIWVIRSY